MHYVIQVCAKAITIMPNYKHRFFEVGPEQKSPILIKKTTQKIPLAI